MTVVSDPITGTVLIYGIHRTHRWWRHVGENMGFESAVVLTDRRGDGDRWVTDDFYEAHERFKESGATRSDFMNPAEVSDAIARCRVLRWLPTRQATAMVLAMAEAMDAVLADVAPRVIVGFPIDNYVQDMLARRARARDIPYFELTASALPDMSMLLHRGRLVTTRIAPDPATVGEKIREIADPLFQPSYVQGQAAYSAGRFLRTFGYHRLRGWFFKLYSHARRDPLNFHYLDAQPGLGHKPRLSDLRILKMTHTDWRMRLNKHATDRRALFGLQLYPEAAIDYWIDDLDLVQHEKMLVELAQGLAAAGYQIVVKDHPLQFGHRQTDLIDRLLAIEGAVFVPYCASGNELLALTTINITATGTLGMQAALLGNTSIVGESYYANDRDFVVLRRWSDLEDVPGKVARRQPEPRLADRQQRIVEQLLSGSFEADYFSFRDFDHRNPNPAATELGRQLGERVRLLGPEGEDWHHRHLPKGGGAQPGSPLN
jgi:hypothetical protein